MATEGSKSSSSPDSYIGSLISLTSKSEIRYEGVLYSINAEESSIGLRNVRSYGTEGRKKDGPQVPPSDKVYEYILFRGSDIKDLQVKSTPPPMESQSIENDPAIIQSHYPRPAAGTTSLPPGVSVPLPDVTSQAPQFGNPASNFQAGLPLYQTGGNLGSWGPTPAPPGAHAGGVSVPIYWHGYYGAPNTLPQLHPQSLLRPPPGLPLPTSLQQSMSYPAFNASSLPGVSNLLSSNLPAIPPLHSTTSSSTVSTPLSLPPSTLPPVPSVAAASDTLSSSVLTNAPNSNVLPMTLTTTFPSRSPSTISNPEASSIAPAVSRKPNAVPGLTLQYKPAAQTSTGSSSASSRNESLAPSLLTPDQLLNSGAKPVSSSQSSQASHKDVETVQVSSSSEPSVPVPNEAQPPILPLPPASKSFNKPSGRTFQAQHSYRGRERGRGNGGSRQVTRFTEDFDFIAMNEKFKKDEVWGSLGKVHKTKEADGEISDLDASEQEDGDLPHIEVKVRHLPFPVTSQSQSQAMLSNHEDFVVTLAFSAVCLQKG
ncbi:hypothetical protein Dimus_014755 [Dionaea muscipula]